MTTDQTGTETLRQALRSYRHRGHLGPMARDLKTSVSELESFIDGRNLPVETKKALAAELLSAVFDPEIDRLRNPNRKEATALPAAPKPLVAGVDFTPTPIIRDYTQVSPRLVKPDPVPPSAFPAKQPGWA
jgi:hypothetical protein